MNFEVFETNGFHQLHHFEVFETNGFHQLHHFQFISIDKDLLKFVQSFSPD